MSKKMNPCKQTGKDDKVKLFPTTFAYSLPLQMV